MEKDLAHRLGVLGHPDRLSLFRLLVRRYPDHVAAGELADALAVKPSTLSAHVTALRHAGLVTQERIGTSLRYSVVMDEIRQMMDALFLGCCRGRPELCSPIGELSEMKRKLRVLFLCTGNSVRSIFAEAILRDLAGSRFEVLSAGLHPNRSVNTKALEVLAKEGIPTKDLSPKHVDTLRDDPSFDFVFTVCDRAANEDCPTWSGIPISAHWGVPSPSNSGGTVAYHTVYQVLRERLEAFAALPLETLERTKLQHAVDDIGRMKSGEIA